MFGIRPTGFDSFKITPRLAEGWNQMALRHIRAFGGDFDLTVSRLPGGKLEIAVDNRLKGNRKSYRIPDGDSVEIKL